MKIATLIRRPSTEQGTISSFRFGTVAIFALELPWRDNTPQISCIPEGVYTLKWRRSPKFGMCYEVTGVPGRGNVLIHPANFAGSAPWTSQLHGCIAPCMKTGVMRNSLDQMQLAGLISRPAVNIFNSWGNKEDIELTISGVKS